MSSSSKRKLLQFSKAGNSRSFMQVYANRLMFWDLVVSAFAVCVSFFINYKDLATRDQTFVLGDLLVLEISPIVRALILVSLWWVAFAVVHSNSALLAGSGIDEYVMIVRASIGAMLAYSLMLVVFKVDTSRLFLFESFILGIPLLILHRRTGRIWLIRQRKKGTFLHRTAITGSAQQVQGILKAISGDVFSGYKPVLVVVSDQAISDEFAAEMERMGVAVRYSQDSSFEWIDEFNLETLIIISGDRFTTERLKQISWSLEGSGLQLIIAPSLLDFSLPRVTTKSVGGVPLLFVKSATFKGPQYSMKLIFDFVLSALGVIITAPFYLFVAVAIWAEDMGPVFFVQSRVGKNGKEFKMIKFRSMAVGSESLHYQLLKSSNKSPNTVMYKNPDDPRITRVGKFIRRWSIDEIPQLINVLCGQMSLVGPRPPLPKEVEQYNDVELRRLLVKPGLTGLWQTRGRSNLSWQETIRLDLDYVENWSLSLDIVLLLRTIVVVFKRDGAG